MSTVVRQGSAFAWTFWYGGHVEKVTVVVRAVKVDPNGTLGIYSSSGSPVVFSRRRHRTVRPLLQRSVYPPVGFTYIVCQPIQPILRLLRVLYVICCNPSLLSACALTPALRILYPIRLFRLYRFTSFAFSTPPTIHYILSSTPLQNSDSTNSRVTLQPPLNIRFGFVQIDYFNAS